MRNKSLLSHFAKYVSLNVIAMLGLSCYILADTFFVSNGLGTGGLAALNLAIPVYSFINGAGLMIGIGGATRYTVNRAQNKDNEANSVFTHSVCFGTVLGIVFFIAGSFFSDELSILLGSNKATFKMCNTYLKTLMCFAPIFILNDILVAFVRNDGSPKLSMSAMLIGSISNIFLDYVFIFPFKMGMFGAAFATGLAPVISIIFMSGYFIKGKNNFHLVRERFCLSNIKTISSLGISSLITEVSSGIVIIIFNITILKLAGNLGVAAYGIIANLALVSTAIFTGIAHGIQPIISENYGVRNYNNIGKALRYALVTSVVFSVVVYAFSFLLSPQIVSIFNKNNDKVLSELAVKGIRIYFIGFLFSGCNIVSASLFSASEKPVQSFVISVLRGFILIVPLLLLLTFILKINGVWMSYPLTEFITLIVAVFFLRQENLNNPF